MEHFNITIKGKVQGVFYRASAQQTANSIGVKGTVCNFSDGSVHIEAEGSLKQLNNFVSWCKQGPSTAKVDEVKVTKGELKNYKTFEIKRS